VLTDIGLVQVEVPRDRDASFEPRIVAKRQRRRAGVNDLVVSLVAQGLTTGEVAAHLAEIYDIEVSRETISNITDQSWTASPNGSAGRWTRPARWSSSMSST
jgi:putative transposase